MLYNQDPSIRGFTLDSNRDDPTVLGFTPLIYFDSTASPLFYEGTDSASAYQTLLRLNEPERARAILDFKNKVQTVFKSKKYFFQSVSGFDTLYSLEPGVTKWMNEKTLTFSTLETLRGDIASMVQRYTSSVFDFRNRRMMVPENTLEFSMDLIVTEIRSLRAYDGTQNENGPNMPLIDDILNVWVYRFTDCLFDFESSNPWTGELSNNQDGIMDNAFNITLGDLQEDHDINYTERRAGREPILRKNSVFSVSGYRELVSSIKSGDNPDEPVRWQTSPRLQVDNPRASEDYLSKIRKLADDLRTLVDINRDNVINIVDNVIRQNQRTKELGNIGLPQSDLEQELRKSLGSVSITYSDLIQALENNVSSFDSNDPLKSFLELIATNTLGNVS